MLHSIETVKTVVGFFNCDTYTHSKHLEHNIDKVVLYQIGVSARRYKDWFANYNQNTKYRQR